MENQIAKTIRIGTTQTYRGRWASVYCKIKYKDGKLSISGVIGPLYTGNALGGCGQIDMEFGHKNPEHNDSRYDNPTKPSEIRFAEGWDAEKWLEFLEIWKLYHLNDMNAGCGHQRALGWKDYDKHPSEPCPTCGYKYSTAWLTVLVPEKALDFLASLPDTDQQPAWV